MPCMTGGGADLYATGFANPNATLKQDIIAQLDIEMMDKWQLTQEELLANRLKNERGSWDQYCFGDTVQHDAFEVTFFPDPGTNYRTILGEEAVFTRVHQDGSLWTGRAQVTQVDAMPNEERNVLSKSTLRIRFTGYSQLSSGTDNFDAVVHVPGPA